MIYTIENQALRIAVSSKGAELDSIYDKRSRLEYLWNAEPAFWAKKSPILFPIVGTLKKDSYRYKNEEYHLSRHGFAREKEFQLASQSADTLKFLLSADEETAKRYPFNFNFYITYKITGDSLGVTYEVQNTGDDSMYFSVGGHPAFRIPLVPGTTYEDYYLEFEKEENAGRWPISADGLIEAQPVDLLQHTKLLPLKKELFLKDALV